MPKAEEETGRNQIKEISMIIIERYCLGKSSNMSTRDERIPATARILTW